MRKGKSIIGLKVVGQTDAAALGTVKDLIFDHDSNELLALLISEKDLFGLIDAQIVPWNQVRTIGQDAVMVASGESKIKAGEDSRVKGVMGRETALSGTRILTTDGQELGTLADTYIDESTGLIAGYEVSGGFFADTMSGKSFMAPPASLALGKDHVAIVPPETAAELEAQKQNEPGGLKAAAATVSDKVSGAYDSAKDKVADTYSNIATASIEKQKAFVVGKVTGMDVILPTAKATMAAPSAIPGTSSTTLEPASDISAPAPSSTDAAFFTETSSPVWESSSAKSTMPPGATPMATDVSSTGETVAGEVLVRKGETITAAQADRAETAGILHQLLLAAGAGATTDVAGSVATAGSSSVDSAGSALQSHTRNSVVGSKAGREVTARDGSTIVAPGMTITEDIYQRAQSEGKTSELAVSAGIATAAQGADTVREHAGNLWDNIKQKTAELTGAAQEKKSEYDDRAEQSKINGALGRPVTRVILDSSDTVILNTGDLITNAAVAQARAAGVLEILLDSVYTTEPEITPEMLRVQEPGAAALNSQAQPSGGPITATVSPETQSQERPAQGAG